MEYGFSMEQQIFLLYSLSLVRSRICSRGTRSFLLVGFTGTECRFRSSSCGWGDIGSGIVVDVERIVVPTIDR